MTQFLDVGSQTNNYPIALASNGSILGIFKRQDLWICYGDTQNDFITRFAYPVGCVSKGSVTVGGGRFFWLSSEGVQMWDGNSAPQNISDGGVAQGGIRSAINVILQQLSYNAISGTDFANDVTCRGFYSNRTYYLSVNSMLGSFTPVTYAYDIISGGWTTLPYGSNVVNVFRASKNFKYYAGLNPFNPYPQIGSDFILGANVANSQVDQWLAAETDLGLPISANWSTQVSDSGAPFVRKQYRYIEVSAPYQAGSVLQVTLVADPGSNQNTAGPFTVNLGSGPARHRISIPKQMTGYQAQLVISSSTTQKTVVDSVAVFGYIKSEHSPECGECLDGPKSSDNLAYRDYCRD